MKQIFEHYEKWEDFKHGMYELSDVLDKDIKVIQSVNLLKTQFEFYNTLKELEKYWPVSISVNLTNKSQNRRAWLGAAACSYKNDCPEYLTRIAWSLLNKSDQDKANKTAETFITEYERKNKGIHTDMGGQMLF
jgi:hypothetical protein